MEYLTTLDEIYKHFSSRKRQYMYSIQIYHAEVGYLRKIPVEVQVKFPRATAREILVPRLVFFANIPPQHGISV